MSDAIYRVQDLRFVYPLGNQRVHALRGVSFEIPKGSFTCLTGPSGSGKSTLLGVLGLIEPVQEGAVHFSGKDLKSLPEMERNRIRRFDVGFVFQSFQLFPVLTAEENVEYFLTRQGIGAKDRADRVRHALESVGLWEHRGKRPLEMSGGQRQRVAIARAIAKRPQVILADEPTASLDQKTGREVMEIFKKLNQESGATLIVCSHDAMVESFAQTKIHLKDGQIA